MTSVGVRTRQALVVGMSLQQSPAGRFAPLKRRNRYATYALIVVVAVGVALAILTREPSRERYSSANFAAAPKEPWKPSPQHDAEANADFGVDAGQSGNVRLAGKSPGADWPSFNGAKRDNR